VALSSSLAAYPGVSPRAHRHVGDGAHDGLLTGDRHSRRAGGAARLHVALPELGDPEIEHLGPAIGRDHDVARLQVAVDDAALVRGGDGFGNRNGQPEELLKGQPARTSQAGQGLPLDELHRQEVHAAGFLDRVDRDDVGVVEGGDGARLSLEPLESIGIAGQLGRQDLERHAAVEPGIVGLVDLAHAARAEGPDDPVVVQRRSEHGRLASGLRGTTDERPIVRLAPMGRGRTPAASRGARALPGGAWAGLGGSRTRTRQRARSGCSSTSL
jgi:hypothetical protein